MNTESETDAAWAALRAERNRRLAECDWTQLPDVPVDGRWAGYRQALRDLPSETPDPLNPLWPEAPAKHRRVVPDAGA